MVASKEDTAEFFLKALLVAVAWIFILAAPSFVFAINISHSSTVGTTPSAKTDLVPDDLKQRGTKLRAAIENKYQELAERNELTVNGSIPFTSNPDKGITSVVMEYIPPGTSFDDAENVLRGAGFTVSPHPRSDAPGTRPDRYNVVASLTSPSLQKWLSRTDIDVDLIPSAPGDYSNVRTLSASITVTYP